MVFSASLSQSSFPLFSHFPQSQSLRRNPLRFLPIRAVKSAEPDNEKKTTEAKPQESSNAQPRPSPKTAPSKLPKNPVYSMRKGQIVRVDKEKYLHSVNHLSVGHPPYYKGLDYIYEDRGEVLDLRIFETGEHALVQRATRQFKVQGRKFLETLSSLQKSTVNLLRSNRFTGCMGWNSDSTGVASSLHAYQVGDTRL